MIPTCCGPWHNGSSHCVTFYLCHGYWTILDPLNPTKNGYPTHETHLHRAITNFYVTRGLPPPTLSPYRRVHMIAI